MEITDFKDKRLLPALKEGKILALPTETVYGLGIFWDDEKAYERLIQAKGRRPDKAIACMVEKDFDFERYFELDDGIRAVMRKFLPGPLTILVKAKEKCPYQSHLGTGICGIRVPEKEELLSFLKEVHKPLQVTSANLSGHPALTTIEEVYQTFQGNKDIPFLVKGICDSSVPTTVVDLSHSEVHLIRQGEIPLDSIKETYYGQHQDGQLRL